MLTNVHVNSDLWVYTLALLQAYINLTSHFSPDGYWQNLTGQTEKLALQVQYI